MTRRILTGDAIPIEAERVRHLARSMVTQGEGRPTEEVMAALEIAVGTLVRAVWTTPAERASVVRQFTRNVFRILGQ
jgi:hypothetical protein